MFRFDPNSQFPIDFTDPTGLSPGDSINWPPTGSHIPQALALDDLAAMELSGLHPIIAQAAQSAMEGKLQALDSRGPDGRNLSRAELEHEMSPSRPVSSEVSQQLDRGCSGLCSAYQGLGEQFPERAPNTKAYLEEELAQRRAVGADQSNFVFAKQGHWAHGEPNPNKQTGQVPIDSISNARSHFNYVTYFPSTRSYAWMNTHARDPFHEQRAYISPHPPYPDTYPNTVWYSTAVPIH